MKQTAVDWYNLKVIELMTQREQGLEFRNQLDLLLTQAKEMEKNNTDNKVIHFAEWLTKKHTSTLITLYEHFEEEYYNETFKSE